MAAYYPVADYLDIITDKICLIRGHKNRQVLYFDQLAATVLNAT
jgi:hypothetical protein